jgi:carbonic anhydrase
MTGIESALARNRAFPAAGGHKRAVVFPNLRLFVFTCLGPRVDPAHRVGLGLSDAIVVRNVVSARHTTPRSGLHAASTRDDTRRVRAAEVATR